MKNLKIKSLAIACSGAVLLMGCSGSGGSPNNSVASGADTPSNPVHAPVKAVRIGSFGIVPTADGTTGKHYLKVDNSTGSTLTLADFHTSDENKTGLVTKTLNSASKLFGGKGYDSRVEVTDCSTLQPGSSCLIGVSPGAAEGSFGLQLNYSDEKGVNYKASQLIEYSPVKQVSDGFLVFNGSTPRISSDDRYSVAIPFVAQDNYTKIELSSRIKPISSSLDCEAGATIGQHCTAILTMPAGEYSNTVTVKGTTADGKVRSFTSSTVSDTNNSASLNITKGPLNIDATSGNPTTGDLVIVNNGISPATDVKEALSLISSTESDISITKYTCGGDATSLPTTLNAGDQCTVSFTANGKDTGADTYKLTYAGGTGVGLTTELTNIYWRGVNVSSSNFNLSGKVDFTNTSVGSSSTTIVHVTNVGEKALTKLAATFDPETPGLSIDSAASTCSAYETDAQFAAGEDCTYVLTYAPTDAASEQEVNLKVNADAADGSAKPAEQRLDFPLSAQTNGNGILITPSNNVAYKIFADGLDKRDTLLTIQNTSKNSAFNLSSVIAQNWSTKLQMVADGNDPHSCATLTSTDGTWTGDLKIPASDYCNIHYTYGPTTDIESGLAQQEFVGAFGTQSFRLPLNTSYQADKTNIVVVESGVVTPKTRPISSDAATNTTEFELVQDNIAQVSFTYKGDIADGFLVKDSDIPFGFLINKDETTCPTTSKGDSAGKLDGSCGVVYDYMSQGLSDSFFYTQVANNQQIEVYPPSYQVIEAGKSIHVVVPDHNTTATHIKADSFVKITSQEESVPQTNHHKVTFKIDAGYDQQNLLGGANVVIQPDWDQNHSVTAVSGSSCVIASPAAGASCDIELAVDSALSDSSTDLKYVAYSSKDSSYNAVRGVASINLR